VTGSPAGPNDRSIRNPLVTLASAMIIVVAMQHAAGVVNVILLSFLIAIAITPFLEMAIKRGMKAGSAVAVTILVVVVGGLTVTGFVGVSISTMIEELPTYEPRMREIVGSITQTLAGFGVDADAALAAAKLEPAQIMNAAQAVLSAGLGVVSMSIVIILIVVFILIEAAGHLVKIRKGEEGRGLMAKYFSFGLGVRKYIGIVAITGAIMATLNTILLAILGVDHPILWGVLSFLFNFVPTFGFVISLIPAAAMALLEFGWGKAAAVAVGYFLINSVVDNVIKPKFMQKGLSVSFLLIVISLIVWTWALGPVGTIVGVPLTMVLDQMYREFSDTGTSRPDEARRA
jgi:predicted PurR-regulated permease PerM